MSDQPVFAPGDQLATARGATALVLSLERDVNKPRDIIGYNVLITEPGKPDHNALLQNGALVGWALLESVEGEALETKSDADEPPTGAIIIAHLSHDLDDANELLTLKDEKIERLTEQLAEARAHLAAPETSPARAADVTSAPVREFDILRKVSVADLDRKDHDGWIVEHMQFSEEGDLNVVFSRICKPAPVEPLRTTVKAVVPQVTITPVEDIPVREHFNAEAYMHHALNEALKAAEAAVADRMPLWEPVINRPALAFGTGPVAKPEPRKV